MPTYEYRCADCGHEFEEFQSMSADPLKTCPNCNKDTLKRVMGTGAGMIFKGGGFYLTDYKNTGGEKKAGTSSKKTETKSDKPAETKKSETNSDSTSTKNDSK